MALMLSDVIVAFDHLKHTVDDPRQRLRRRATRGRPRARASRRSARSATGSPARCRASTPRRARSRSSSPTCRARTFEAMVARIIEYIHAGDAFQVVPSQRWSRRGARRAVLDLPRPARGQPVAVHVLPRLRGLPDRRRVARSRCSPSPAATSPRARSPAPARAARPSTRTSAIAAGAARRREGARRARDARRPRPQRPRPRLRVRHASTSSD